jgi:hypothetical protein
MNASVHTFLERRSSFPLPFTLIVKDAKPQGFSFLRHVCKGHYELGGGHRGMGASEEKISGEKMLN